MIDTRFGVRRWQLGPVVALLVALGACSDGGTTPEPTIVDVEINGAPTTALAIGDTAKLSAVVANSAGKATTDAAAASWTSSDPAVAAVPAPGTVVGVGPGVAKIVATAGSVSDTVEVSVSAVITGCPAAGLSFPVGAIRQFDPKLDLDACPTGGAAGAEYVLVAFNGDQSGEMNFTVSTAGLLASLSAPGGLSASRVAGQGRLDGGAVRGDEFHFGLMEWGRRNRARLAPAAVAMQRRTQSGARFSMLAAVPVVGDRITLNVEVDNACSSPKNISARVAAVSTHAVVVVDTANPVGGFTDDQFRHIATTFDTLVYPVDTLNFGPPADIDQNQRVVILYTRAVNELTTAEMEGYVGGFFHPRDVYPRVSGEGLPTCQGSNLAEMFYMLAPDPEGRSSHIKHTTQDVLEETIATIAHEFQHLIQESRRIYVNNTWMQDETVWLNEGLSHIAEELIFYRATGLTPRQNLTGPQVLASHRQRFIEYQGSNYGRLASYYRKPSGSSPYASNDDLGTRGAIWSFLRYVADQSKRPEREIWRALANSSSTGLNNLRDALSTDPIPLVRDWTVANYADDRVSGSTGRYAHPSWNHESVFAQFQSRPTLEVVGLTNGVHTRSIVAGGGSYFRVNVPANGRAEIRVSSGGVAPAASLSTFLVRTR